MYKGNKQYPSGETIFIVPVWSPSGAAGPLAVAYLRLQDIYMLRLLAPFRQCKKKNNDFFFTNFLNLSPASYQLCLK